MRTTLPESNELASMKASCFIMHEDCSKGLVNNELAVGEMRGKLLHFSRVEMIRA